jgi:hypothetical protein
MLIGANLPNHTETALTETLTPWHYAHWLQAAAQTRHRTIQLSVMKLISN